MNKADEIIGFIQSVSGSHSPAQIFDDWVTCMALSIANCSTIHRGTIWKKREDQYLATVSKYDCIPQIVELFARMQALLIETLDENITDALGDIYMRGGMGNKLTGQFFTPFQIDVLTAELATTFDDDGMVRLQEPSCGGGGMIIAVARKLHTEGKNYQKIMRVVAQDLDWRSVYMCYVQLSFLGINAIVVQGDTLSDPYRPGFDQERIFRTPKNAGAI